VRYFATLNSSHNTKQKITRDAERERYLQRLGYQVIRFTGTEVFKDVQKCVNEVLSLAKIEPAGVNANTDQSTPESNQDINTPVEFTVENKSTDTLQNSSVGGAALANKKGLARHKHKYKGMKAWQIMILGTMLMVTMCLFLCLASLLLNIIKISY